MSAAWDGRPEQPERDGWHWLHHPEDLRPCPAPWDAAHAAWCGGGMHSPQGVVDLGYHYLGPALLPAEVAAREAAAERRGIGRAAALVAAFRANVQNELDHAKSAQAESALAAAVSALDEAERAIRALLVEGER